MIATTKLSPRALTMQRLPTSAVVGHRAVLGIASAISSGVSGKSCTPSLSKCMLLMPHGSRPVRLR
jgi:hypothetical protein